MTDEENKASAEGQDAADAALAEAEAMAAEAGAGAEADADEDPWAAAMAEQAAAESPEEIADDPMPAHKAVSGSDEVFRPLGDAAAGGSTRELDIIMNIPVMLNVELGRTRISIKQLLELSQGSVLELDGLAGDPMDILINGYLIAQGEVVVVEDKYGIRITDIITPSERVKKLNR